MSIAMATSVIRGPAAVPRLRITASILSMVSLFFVNLTIISRFAAFAVKPAPLFQGAESGLAPAKPLIEMQFVNAKKCAAVSAAQRLVFAEDFQAAKPAVNP